MSDKIKEVKKFKDLIGKTIKDVIADDDSLWLSFTDGSICLLDASEESSGFSRGRIIISVNKYGFDETSKELVTLGIITEAVHRAAVIAADEAYEARQKMEDEKERAKIEEHEREYLRTLSEKYGTPAS